MCVFARRTGGLDIGHLQNQSLCFCVRLWSVEILDTHSERLKPADKVFPEDMDVDSQSAFADSEWLRANVWLDQLRPGHTCYLPGERRQVRMADVPPLAL